MRCSEWKRTTSTSEVNLSLSSWTQRPQPELSHLHKKTLARFTALSLEYHFVIQNKTGSGMPLFLRAASPAQVNALSPTNPQVLRLQSEDPDLQLLYNFRITQAWPGDLQPDHRLRLETLNKNLLIDNDNVVWVQCKPESPEAPPKTALYRSERASCRERVYVLV